MSDDEMTLEQVDAAIAFYDREIEFHSTFFVMAVTSNLYSDAELHQFEADHAKAWQGRYALFETRYRIEQGVTIEELEEPEEYALFILQYGHELGDRS